MNPEDPSRVNLTPLPPGEYEGKIYVDRNGSFYVIILPNGQAIPYRSQMEATSHLQKVLDVDPWDPRLVPEPRPAPLTDEEMAYVRRSLGIDPEGGTA